jgi:ABC-type nitrate/sulfonate/bicarbonate transport system substrate-binding protein
MTIAHLLAGESENLWEPEGIDLNAKVTGYGRYSAALKSGEAKLNNVNSAITMNLFRDGEDIVWIGPQSTIVNGAFVPKDSDIESPEDFEGKTIGLPFESSGTTMVMTSMIQDEYGYDLEEIAEEIVYTGPGSLWNLMTEQGDLDVMFQFTGPTIRGRAEGSPVRQVFNPNEYWLDRTGGRALITFWAAKRSWLENNPETALGFLRGWESALEYLENNTGEVIDSYGSLAGFTTSEQQAVVEEVLSEGANPPPSDWDEKMAKNNLKILDRMVHYDFYEQAPSFEEGVVTYSQLEEMAGE